MSGTHRPLPIPKAGRSGDPNAAPAPAPPQNDMNDDARSARSTSHSRSDAGSVAPSIAPSSVSVSSSRRVPFPDTLGGATEMLQPPLQPSPSLASSSTSSTPSVTSHPPSAAAAAVPSEPLPDSLLCRSSFAALEHSAGTLKRLAKVVLDRSTEVMALLEQVEKAEDEMLASLGELGRWLEGGYGVKGDVWEDNTGMRKVARDKRRREKEELEVMVVHSLEAVKGEIKRQGLAGNGAQARFENAAKQYYSQTASYLGTGGSGEVSTSASDQAQAARHAQFDLLRYNHHSTLLYAVPPSSVGCLDLLVGLYGWVGAQLSQSPGKRADTHPPLLEEDFARAANATSGGAETPTQRGRALAVSETPIRLLLRDDESVRGSQEALSRTLSLSLAHLVNVRGDLLKGWAARDHQTTLLEDAARRLQNASVEPKYSMPGTMPTSTSTSASVSPAPTSIPTTPELSASMAAPISSAAREQKPKKKIGGKIRGLFSSSTPLMPTLAERAPPVSSSNLAQMASRQSVDVSRPPMPAPASAPVEISHISDPRLISTTSPQVLAQTSFQDAASIFPMPPPRPARPDGRRSVDVRRSMPLPPGAATAAASFESMPPTPGSAPPSRSRALADTAAKLNGAQVGGVGGLDGTEDEQRELVGRKKEGVLWGTGSWEALDRDSGRSKWERFWVVLANSSLYEHRDVSSGTGKPESSATVIDLKFASVREGRGTDRRFVFEVVTPSHGRRLYQATSEAEMRTWIYTICNAIESCINGTSTVRGSDLHKMASSDSASIGSGGGLSVGNFGAGIGGTKSDKSSSRPKTKNGARSSMAMPPPSQPVPPRIEEPRKGRTSLKSRFKHGAEMAGDKLSTVVGGGKRSSMDLERPAFLAQGGRMPSYNSSSLNSRRASWYDDDDLERRVMEMAASGSSTPAQTPGVSGGGPRSVTPPPQPGAPAFGSKKSSSARPSTAPSSGLTHKNSLLRRPGPNAGSGLREVENELAPAPAPAPVSALSIPAPPPGAQERLDMSHLRRIASLGANQRCADCGRATKTSRWATLSLREVPMVMFLCIRCVGLHRGLGTHISKPRSVDLDNWSQDAILLAHQWGNERANAVWERRKPAGVSATDENIGEYIQAKYVEGRWLAETDRARFGFVGAGRSG